MEASSEILDYVYNISKNHKNAPIHDSFTIQDLMNSNTIKYYYSLAKLKGKLYKLTYAGVLDVKKIGSMNYYSVNVKVHEAFIKEHEDICHLKNLKLKSMTQKMEKASLKLDQSI